MKIDKEYPATHSMSTSWYMADDEGNVGIMQFDDNGPIPLGVRQDGSFANNLIFGEGFNKNDECGSIQLDKEQLDELLGQPHSVSEEDNWFDIIVKIDKSKKELFMNIVNNSKIDYEGCISEEYGLYKIDCWDCTNEKDNSIKHDSGLDQIIKAEIIECVYKIPELAMDCEYNHDTKQDIFIKEFDNAPYYIYLQPYWPDMVQKRMNKPSHPVKIAQIDEKCRDKILKIPGKFKDIDRMQIARWYPSVVTSMGNAMHVGENEYVLLPMEDGTERWILTDRWSFDYYEFCPTKLDKRCEKCDSKCASMFNRTDILTPTILFITSAKYEHQNFWTDNKLRNFEDKLVALSYLPKFPQKSNQHYVSIRDIKKDLTHDKLCDIFSRSYAWLENAISTLRPNVIIIDDRASSVFQTKFPISQHLVEINAESYPIYLRSELSVYKETISRLSEMPYRGSLAASSYSIEEMEELKKQGKAHD
nr:hypothetical protein [uncultured Prevotella sp.]